MMNNNPLAIPEVEGVIKFNLHHQVMPFALATDALMELNSWRLLMYRLQLICQDPKRYGGLAYGNVSCRVDPDSSQFVISGTQTSAKEILTNHDLSLVTAVNLAENTLYAQGEAKPSSEALTHASVYQQDAAIQAVIHVHSPEIWRLTVPLKLAHTPEDVAYGTPAMAQAVAELFKRDLVQTFGIFSMLGHQDGIVAFGPNLATAADLIIQAWVTAHQVAE